MSDKHTNDEEQQDDLQIENRIKTIVLSSIRPMHLPKGFSGKLKAKLEKKISGKNSDSNKAKFENQDKTVDPNN